MVKIVDSIFNEVFQCAVLAMITFLKLVKYIGSEAGSEGGYSVSIETVGQLFSIRRADSCTPLTNNAHRVNLLISFVF